MIVCILPDAIRAATNIYNPNDNNKMREKSFSLFREFRNFEFCIIFTRVFPALQWTHNYVRALRNENTDTILHRARFHRAPPRRFTSSLFIINARVERCKRSLVKSLYALIIIFTEYASGESGKFTYAVRYFWPFFVRGYFDVGVKEGKKYKIGNVYKSSHPLCTVGRV